MVDYYRTTEDSRIVFGKGGWSIAFGGRLHRGFDRHERRAKHVAEALRHAYPQLDDVAIADTWSGPIDRPAKGLPLIGHLGGRRHLLYGVGWSGNGVGPALIGARMLAGLALGSRDEWTESPLVDGVPGAFPPEPVRFLGAHVVRTAVARKETAEREGRRVGRVAGALSTLAPGSFASGGGSHDDDAGAE